MGELLENWKGAKPGNISCQVSAIYLVIPMLILGWVVCRDPFHTTVTW